MLVCNKSELEIAIAAVPRLITSRRAYINDFFGCCAVLQSRLRDSAHREQSVPTSARLWKTFYTDVIRRVSNNENRTVIFTNGPLGNTLLQL